MNRLRQIFLWLGAAALGFALGLATGGHPGGGTPGAVANDSGAASGAAAAAHGADDEAVAAALGTLLGSGDFRQFAQLGAALEKLDATQMRAFFDKLNRLPYHERDIFLPRLLAYWAKRDPQAATEWMQPCLARSAKRSSFGGGGIFANLDTNLVKAWAENAPELALEFARQHPEGSLGEIVLHNAVYRLPGKKDAQRFEVLRDFPAGAVRTKVLVSFFNSWARTNNAAALAACASLPPGLERIGALTQVLQQLASREPAAALARAGSEGLDDPALLTLLVCAAGKSDPVMAALWLEKQDGLVGPAGGVFVREWAKRDPAAAFAWAASHGISPSDFPTAPKAGKDYGWSFAFELTGNSPLSDALREKPESTLVWLRALPAGPERERNVEHAIARSPDPNLVESLVALLPPDAAARAAGNIASSLATNAPEKAQQWAESLTGPTREAAWTAIGWSRTEPLPLPPGADRDAMLYGMATGHAITEPEKALDRAAEIGNLALRRRTLDDVFWKLNRGPVDVGGGGFYSGATEAAKSAARAWLENAKIPEEWRQAWR